MSSQDGKERLLQLLDYVQHIVRLPERARFSVKDSGSFVYLQENLHKQIGVQYDVRGPHGRAWLKLVRLQRIDPPEVSAELSPWISMIRNPFKEPKVALEQTKTVTAAEGSWEFDRINPAASFTNLTSFTSQCNAFSCVPGRLQLSCPKQRTRNPMRERGRRPEFLAHASGCE